ncbi:HlyC/CorC family transporter [Candidatus Woesearchaeota archaeon]|nr:MAG: HlyC/CorC family transporter [Candidatus Woesearchaeota archaeon]
MQSLQAELLILAGLLSFSAFFSGVETALVSVSPARTNLLLKKKLRNAEFLQKLKSDPHRMLTTILIGNNLVNIAAAAITTDMMIKLVGSNAVGIATGVMTLFILVFGEITPKSVATRYSVQMSLFSAPIIYFLSKVFFPLSWFLDLFTLKVINKLFGPPPEPKITEEELRNYIKLSEQSGSIDKNETRMLENIIEFEDVIVKEIMTPRPHIVGVTSGATVKEVVNSIMKSGHSRIPVFDSESGSVVGVIIVKDVLEKVARGKLNAKIESLVREPLFVPETMRLNELLTLFRRKKTHIAIVVDEYGTVSGLVTLEDVLEEIVGDLFDETDKPVKEIRKLSDNQYSVSGLAYLDDVNEKLSLNLESDSDVESIGGYVVDKLGHLPVAGEKLNDSGVEITVKEVKDNRVDKVVLKLKRKSPGKKNSK